MSIGEKLYSFGDFPYLNPVNFLWDPYNSTSLFANIPSLWSVIWYHHNPVDGFATVGGEEGFVLASNPWASGSKYNRRYTSEIEVIHNELKEQVGNQIFTSFSFNTDVYLRGLDYTVQEMEDMRGFSYLNSDTGPMDNIYQHLETMTKEFSPGFQSFVLWNSHQCSGEVDLNYFGSDINSITANNFAQTPAPNGWSVVGNIRKNGADWCVNRFRDIVRNSGISDKIGVLGTNTSNVPQTYFANLLSGNVWTGKNLWIQSGMSEYLNPLILDPNHPRRKFVDKWIALRLICRNRNKIVNLLSTKVDTRKYHRHEKK